MNTQTIICKHCSKPFEVPLRRIRHREKMGMSPFVYCSSECRVKDCAPKELTLCCVICNTQFTKKDNEDKICCSRVCAGKLGKPKEQKYCKSCNKEIPYNKHFCTSCVDTGRHRLKRYGYKPQNEIRIKDLVRRKGASRYDIVRQWARRDALKDIELPCCERCGYNKHVEVAHRKPVSDFSEETLISEVNSKENLMLLCPNCHWEFDHNLALL